MTTKTEKRIAWAVLVALLVTMGVLSNAYAQVAISALPPGAAVTGTDVVPNVQGATTVKTTAVQLVDFARLSIAPGSANQLLYSNGSGVLTASSTTFDSTNGKLVSIQGGANFPGFRCANGTTSVASCEFLGGDGTTIGGTARMRGGAATGVGNAGNSNIFGGTATDGVGGTVSLIGGTSAGTNRVGGAISISASSGTGSAAGGAVDIVGGTSGTGNGSQISINGGTGGNGGVGGLVQITGGSGNATLGAGGAVTIQGGPPAQGDGGAVSIIGRNGVGTNRNGGNVSLTTGTATGSGTAGALFATTGGTERLRILGNGAWSVGTGGAATGTSGQVLTSTGATTPPTWQAAGGGTPAGANTQIQYNNGGAFGAAADFTFTSGTRVLQVGAATDGTIQSASSIPLTIGNSAGNTSLTLRAAGTSNMLFQSGGVTRMTLSGSTNTLDIAASSGIQSSGSIQTLGGANFVANSSGGFFADTANPAFKSNTDADTGMGIRAGNVNTVDFTCGGALCGSISPTAPLPTSGTYTPTLTNSTNVASSAAFTSSYMRVGAVVNVAMRVDVTPTAGAGAITLLGVSLPVASTISADTQLSGVCNGTESGVNVNTPAILYGDIGVGNNRATLDFNASSTNIVRFRCNFQYTVQ